VYFYGYSKAASKEEKEASVPAFPEIPFLSGMR
jgi:hypothetical protein